MIAALGGALLALGAASPEEGARAPIAVGELALRGPLDEVELAWDSGDRARVRIALGPDERRTVPVPGPSAFGHRERAPTVRPSGSGSARWRPREPRGPWPATLWGRARPALPDASGRPWGAAPAELALCAASVVFVFASRRRPSWALALGLTAGGAFALVPRAAPAASSAVLEGAASEPVWIALERHALGGPPVTLAVGPDDRLEREPAGAPLEWTVRADGAGWSWIARGRLGALVHGRPVAPAPLDARRNDHVDLAVVFRRAPDGAWSRLGAWPRGAPPPGAPGPSGSGGASEPPGWVRTALPLGVPILVGRTAADSERWIRVVLDDPPGGPPGDPAAGAEDASGIDDRD